MKRQDTSRCAEAGKRGQRGLSLIELMVSLAIGSVVIAGAVYVYMQSRNSYATNESVARLQETARYAMSVIEPDIRMSNYWGLLKGAGSITEQAVQTVASVGLPTSCGPNFARDLLTNMEGSNNGYAMGCTAFGAGAQASADTLTVRRASTLTAASINGSLQICSTRLAGRLVADGAVCTSAPAGQVNNLIVNAYYVARDSVQRAGLPALRRQMLNGDTATATPCATVGLASPCFVNQEITPGIEDLQVKFGIDPTGVKGVATRYVDPGAVPAAAQIVSVRIWLLVRADDPEVGFIDGRTYQYGDRDPANGTVSDLSATGAGRRAYAPGDRFRRLLISRTIQVRNALGT